MKKRVLAVQRVSFLRACEWIPDNPGARIDWLRGRGPSAGTVAGQRSSKPIAEAVEEFGSERPGVVPAHSPERDQSTCQSESFTASPLIDAPSGARRPAFRSLTRRASPVGLVEDAAWAPKASAAMRAFPDRARGSAARRQRLCYFQRDRVGREPATERDDPVEETGDHDAAPALEAVIAEARDFGGTHHVAHGAVENTGVRCFRKFGRNWWRSDRDIVSSP